MGCNGTAVGAAGAHTLERRVRAQTLWMLHHIASWVAAAAAAGGCIGPALGR
jgi:hypothetical protein